MLVSIIMGVYNSQETVVAAIETIFSQTYHNLELIVCDDGSNDSTYLKLCECKKNYGKRLIILQNAENLGLAATLNRCLKIANGDIIARMDGDDKSCSQRLEHQIMYLQKHKEIFFVGCNAHKFNENGIYGHLCNMEYPKPKDLCVKNCFIHPTIVIYRKALESVDGYTEHWSTTRCEDYDLWFKLYAHGYYGANLQEYLFEYYEGNANFVKRKYRYRICEAIVRYLGIRANNLPWYLYLFIFKPLLVGLVPTMLMQFIKHKFK